jgi:hypothetical protein
MKYFPLLYRLDGEDGYLIWISNDNDGVVADARGFVPTFSDVDAVQAYARPEQYELESEEPKLHDLDWVAAWLKVPGKPVNCRKALEAWNLFSDAARSIHVHGMGSTFEPLDSQFPGIYDKLFWGSNLPSMTPEGRHYDPEWSPDELTALAEVLRAGLEMFQSSTRSFQQNP